MVGINNVSGATSYFDELTVKALATADLFATHDSASPNVLIGAKLSAYVANTCAGLVARLDSASSPANFIIAYQFTDQNGAKVKIEQCVAGVYAELGSYTSAYVAGDRLVLRLSGSAFRLYKVNTSGTPTLLGTGTTTVLSGTLHGLFSTYEGNKFDNYSCWAVGAEGQYAALADIGMVNRAESSSWLTERVTQEFRTVGTQRQWATRLNLRRFIR
jgi:hypothetical protein